MDPLSDVVPFAPTLSCCRCCLLVVVCRVSGQATEEIGPPLGLGFRGVFKDPTYIRPLGSFDAGMLLRIVDIVANIWEGIRILRYLEPYRAI